MSKQVTVAGSNWLCQARMNAGEHNPEFLSRPGAIKYLPGVTEDCLKKYELEINTPSNEVIALMADAYNQPELRQRYCAKICPLGKYTREICAMPSERAYIHLNNSSEEMNSYLDDLCQIMDDGEITHDELPKLSGVVEHLLKTRQRIDEVLAAIEKAKKTGKFS